MKPDQLVGTITPEMMGSRIQSRLDAGWRFETECGREFFLPPPEDPRRNWCAKWLELLPGKLFPHWILREWDFLPIPKTVVKEIHDETVVTIEEPR